MPDMSKPDLPKPPPAHAVKPKFLLVVDVQKGFVTDTSRHVLSKIEAVQERFETVIYARFINPAPSPFRSILDYHKLGRGSPDADFAIRPCPGAAVMEHTAYSSVTGELLYWLRDRQVSEVCVCGIATEACVLKTVVDLFESHFVPWVVQDLCASDKDDRFHDMAVEVIGALIGQQHVITVETLAVD